MFVKTKVRTLTFRKPELQSFKELVNKTPWETALREKGAEQSWQIFTITFHAVQEFLITRYKISGQEGKTTTWMGQDLLAKLKGKNETYKQRNQRQRSW